MLLLEFEGKALLREAGVTVPRGIVMRGSGALPRGKISYPVAIKAQVAAGGRGKAGGVVKAESAAQAKRAAKHILGCKFGGEYPRAVLLEPWLPIKRELYLSVTVDGAADGYTVLYSPRGGVDVERGVPPVRYNVGRLDNFRAYRLRELLAGAEADASVRERVISVARRLILLAGRRECTTVEINPLAVLADGSVIAADAKVVRDDHAAFRVADIGTALEQARKRERPAIARALAGKLMLVWLDGEVGLISGGAGMTMAAMDLIADAGGKPACFLDCSNNPTPDGYQLAFDLLDKEPEVRVILVSIFGGLTQMDRAARTMCDIMRSRKSKKTVVFRLNGTNAGKANELFAAAGLHNHESLEDAIKETVAAARRGKRR